MLKTETLSNQLTTYRILAELFRFPVEDYHGQAKTYQSLVSAAEKLEPKFLKLACKLEHSAKKATIEDLCEEYHRLFDPEGRQEFPYLHAHNYLNQEPDLCEYLSRIYESHEFGREFTAYALDHLCNELDFIRHLNTRSLLMIEASKPSQASEIQKFKCTFLRNHLIQWLPELTKYIIFNSKSAYFLQLSIITRTVLVNCINRENNIN
ncbi:MAG: molecular chaperone TorD family protein [Lentimicrobiaceae bacterium]|nr:molecular chaperone TorD family protein [Lentimicrobiaceae bacterium]